jgi:cytochrome c oxidase subunit 3
MATHKITLEEYKTKLANNRLALWLFVLSDSFVFMGLLVSRFTLLGDHRPELNQFLGLAVTSLLLASSFFMNRAETEMADGNTQGFLRGLLTTFILGVIFLLGVVGVEWQLAGAHGLTPSSGAEGAIFYAMTGFHAFHVLTGVIFLWIVYRNGKRGIYSAERHWGVQAAAIYWHFVDVAWIFFYPALYLMGTVAG